MQRIEKFLAEEEVPNWASSLKDDITKRSLDVGFVEASFSWHNNTSFPSLPTKFILGPLDFAFPLGKLSLVTGVTGAGKTALLAALLGGMLILFTLSLALTLQRNGMSRRPSSYKQA